MKNRSIARAKAAKAAPAPTTRVRRAARPAHPRPVAVDATVEQAGASTGSGFFHD